MNKTVTQHDVVVNDKVACVMKNNSLNAVSNVLCVVNNAIVVTTNNVFPTGRIRLCEFVLFHNSCQTPYVFLLYFPMHQFVYIMVLSSCCLSSSSPEEDCSCSFCSSAIRSISG